jgi:ABC-type uncharacterized transport system permease subunit
MVGVVVFECGRLAPLLTFEPNLSHGRVWVPCSHQVVLPVMRGSSHAAVQRLAHHYQDALERQAAT